MGDHARGSRRRRCSSSRRCRVVGPLANAVAIPLGLGGRHAARARRRGAARWTRCCELCAAWLVAVAARVPRMVRAAAGGALAAARAAALERAARARGRGAGCSRRAAFRGARAGARADAAGVSRCRRRRPRRARPGSPRSTSGRGSRCWCAPRTARCSTTPGRRSAPRPTAASASSRPTCAPTASRGSTALVLTHDDTDHIGGAPQRARQASRSTRSLSSLPAGHPLLALAAAARGAARRASAGSGTACASRCCIRAPAARREAAQRPELRAAR